MFPQHLPCVKPCLRLWGYKYKSNQTEHSKDSCLTTNIFFSPSFFNKRTHEFWLAQDCPVDDYISDLFLFFFFFGSKCSRNQVLRCLWELMWDMSRNDASSFQNMPLSKMDMFPLCPFSCPLPLAGIQMWWQELVQLPWTWRLKLCVEFVNATTLEPPKSGLVSARKINLILFEPIT